MKDQLAELASALLLRACHALLLWAAWIAVAEPFGAPALTYWQVFLALLAALVVRHVVRGA